MKKLIVDYGLLYNRIALMNGASLEEMYIERLYDKSLVGNIYLGRVVNTVKSMSACFIDIGVSKNAYMPLEEHIKTGMETLVQVKRDPVGDKGATVTTDLSLSSRHLVLLPRTSTRTISKKIHDKETKSLILNALNPYLENYGIVIRTDAAHVELEVLIAELKELIETWKGVEQKERRILSNRLVYADYAFESLLEKEYVPLVDEIIVNKKIELNHPNVTLDLEAYPIFEKYRVESQIKESLNREIKLHQGSFITIDETEALTAIDVNSGQFVGSKNKEETFLQVNLAAAKEISRQIRLRNISGIIIVDFINMRNKDNYELLLTAMKKHFKEDKCQPKIHGLTTLGLVEITRKKNRKSLRTQLIESCKLCSGAGYALSKDVIFSKLVDKIKLLKSHTQKETFEVNVSENMYNVCMTMINGKTYLDYLMDSIGCKILLNLKESLEGFDFETSGK